MPQLVEGRPRRNFGARLTRFVGGRAHGGAEGKGCPVATFNAAEFQRKMRQAQREVQREIDRVNRENQRRVDAFNREQQRKVEAHNRKAHQHNAKIVLAFNEDVSRVNTHNQRADRQNAATIDQLNRQLRGAGPVRYTEAEQALADRVQDAISKQDDRELDVFLSYARIDGSTIAIELKNALEALGVQVWFDEVAIVPGQSQALQMDRGLRRARCGIAVLTAAYLAGRFWTERELGALLHKETLIPVLHGVTFEQVSEYSGILPDLAGFETRHDSVEVIAEKIAAAVLAG